MKTYSLLCPLYIICILKVCITCYKKKEFYNIYLIDAEIKNCKSDEDYTTEWEP